MCRDNIEMMFSFPFVSVNLNCLKNIYLTAQKSVNHLDWQVTTAKSLLSELEHFQAEISQSMCQKGRLMYTFASNIATIN